MSTPNRGSCYCEDGETSCGDCQICGKPGHTRPFPGPVPYTSSWCDEHYDMLTAEFRAGGSGAPTQYFKFESAADGGETECIYVACHQDWAVSLVVVNAASAERFDRDATFDMPDFFGIWFAPVSRWTGELQPVSADEFDDAYRKARKGKF